MEVSPQDVEEQPRKGRLCKDGKRPSELLTTATHPSGEAKGSPVFLVLASSRLHSGHPLALEVSVCLPAPTAELHDEKSLRKGLTIVASEST